MRVACVAWLGSLLKGKEGAELGMYEQKHNTLLWRNLSSARILSLPLIPISDPLSSPVANILVSDSFVPRHLPLAQVDLTSAAVHRSDLGVHASPTDF